jgi:hypothetical protein
VIPYAFPSLAVLFVVLPFSDQASYSVNITLVWGANLEADITDSKFGTKGVINGN